MIKLGMVAPSMWKTQEGEEKAEKRKAVEKIKARVLARKKS